MSIKNRFLAYQSGLITRGEMSVSVRKYRHLYHRVEYPLEGGYRWETSPLPAYCYVTITEDKIKDCKYLTVYSRIHLNKQVKMEPSYSLEWRDIEILKDISAEICYRFGV